MTTTALATQQNSALLEQVVVQGDLSKLTPRDRVLYYRTVCESVGLNPLTKPFEYINLNGKLRLYALKEATDQLRELKKVSVKIVGREVVEDCYVVTAQATNKEGRYDESIGAVAIGNLKGEFRANAMMKCETKAKRRVTLSICGLGMLDETEVGNIPSAKTVHVDMETGEIDPDDEALKALEQRKSTAAQKSEAATPGPSSPHEGSPSASAGAPEETRDATLTRLCKIALVNKIDLLAKAEVGHADEMTDEDYMSAVAMLQRKITKMGDRVSA